MTERERLLRIIDDLNLPEGRWVLQGSGVLIMHGLERAKPMGDVDIFVATDVWFDMYEDTRPIATGGEFVVEARDWRLYTTDPSDPKRRCDPPYLYRDMYGIPVHVFYDWRKRGIGDIDCNFIMHNAEMVDGVPCTPLQMMLDWKRAVGRAKDVDDIRLLEDALGDAAA